MSTRSRKTFCFPLYVDESANRPTIQSTKLSVAQSSNNKVTYRNIRQVTEWENNPILKSSIHLNTTLPDHSFVQSANFAQSPDHPNTK